MTDTAADFLLEYLMQLINCDNKLIVKVYEAKLIEKDQIEWVYEAMQFLRIFLKDAEDMRNKHDKKKVQEVVAKIRDVIHEVEVIIDSCLLDAAVTPEDTENFEFQVSRRTHKISNLDAAITLEEDTANFEFQVSEETLARDEETLHVTMDLGPIEKQVCICKFISQMMMKIRIFVSQMLTTKAKLCPQDLEIRPDPELRPEELEIRSDHKLCPQDLEIRPDPELRPEELEIRSDHVRFDKIHRLKFLEFNYSHDEEIHRLNLNDCQYDDNFLVQNNESEENIFPSFDIFWTGIKSLVADKIHHGLEGVIEEIKVIKEKVMRIYEKKMYVFGAFQIEKSSRRRPVRATSHTVEREIVVGLEDETTAIINLLTEGHEKQLKVIPIVGMPGLGKTTLATRLYNDSLIVYHFYVRAWTSVSQVYHKRDLLLNILNSANIHLACDKLGDEKLGEALYRHLKGNRYLIVMDDIWNISAWNDLKRYLPNDNNGSRIIFTTRLGDVAVSLHAKPHHLRFLNEDESWDLLRQKTFLDEDCPPDLTEIGRRIAKKCGGLPLAIVVVSGVLLAKNNKTQDWWRHIAESLSSYIVSDPKRYMDTLALSYNYLPNHLKSCFLYFGAFPEDYEIPAWQLIWLWIGEGLIRQNESKGLEDVAEDNLMDLVGRSLVVVSKKRSDGRIKSCRIHDLLRDFCLTKAQEENFLHQIFRYKQTSSSSLDTNKLLRLCTNSHLDDYIGIKHHALYVRSFLFLDRSFHDFSKKMDVSFICRNLKLLRVLNLSSFSVHYFPREIQLLIHLRYLALHYASHGNFNSSISNLWNLETYIVGGSGGHVSLPDNMWKTVKLRHLYTKHLFKLPQAINLHSHSALYNLQTIGNLDLRSRNKLVLALMPNLRKVKCVSDDFPKLDFLINLEALQVSYNGVKRNGKLPQTSWFPPNLKNLTLSSFRLPWEEVWTLTRLPNLEVLKLSHEAFEGSTWDSNDSEFRTLRFLKLRGLDIEQWNACSNHFPQLQRLVLDCCKQLKEIPSGLGDVPTLEMIQLQYCSSSAETSARQIQEEQESLGNDGLKIFVQSWRQPRHN
ncbi:putative late blight resistance protein homolog R1A-3 [Cornus florida]|uniref:putative late blight resistance protein homolog R1A-3 n=1 Tax=Cornus florida TaxID=4283 RepID=UPI00289E194E|nr:putative late blight resistance protein homolog R1A-3 [Cornus florida]